MTGDLAFDLRLEVAARDVQRAGKGTLLVLVGLADVEQDGAGQASHVVGGGGVDLADLALGLGQQVAEAGHGKSLPARSGLRYAPDRPIPRCIKGRDQGATITGRRSLIEPRSTTSASMSISVRLRVQDDHEGAVPLGDRHHVGRRVHPEGGADCEQHVGLLGDREGPVDHLGHERLAERDRRRLEDAAAGAAGRILLPGLARARALVPSARVSPQLMQTTWRIVPCTSITRPGSVPAFWCSSSTFCVTTACSLPARSSSTIARWPSFGCAFHAGESRRERQACFRTSGSPM